VEHGVALGRVEVGQELLVRGDGHGPMLAAPSGVAQDVSATSGR
jgi:hypothetical protein